MKIGIDFDNTIINYGQLFYKYAIDRFGMPSTTKPDKNSIRSYFWSIPDGNTKWTELQGIVYGEKILEAAPAEGFRHFLSSCKESDTVVCIISHKSEFPALGPRINLRNAAMDWLTSNSFFDYSKYALTESSVFFESTRTFKIMRIVTEKCTVFIDDLQEVFAEVQFPAEVKKILYSQESSEEKDVLRFDNWALIEAFVMSIKATGTD